jgi:hypothetical protein
MKQVSQGTLYLSREQKFLGHKNETDIICQRTTLPVFVDTDPENKKGRVNTHPFHLTKPIKLIKPKPMN